jgi:hypothetical protein
MVSGKHNQDNPGDTENKNFNVYDRINFVCQKCSQYKGKDAHRVKRRPGETNPCLYFVYVRILHKLPKFVVAVY